jgi:hypothetical protein
MRSQFQNCRPISSVYDSRASDLGIRIRLVDPAILVAEIQDGIFFSSFSMLSCFTVLFEGAFTSFFKEKIVIKKSQNSRNQGFFYYFCLKTEGSGSVHLTNGPGSGRPENIRILGSGSRNTGLRSTGEVIRYRIVPVLLF